jgi:hypothetical protein
VTDALVARAGEYIFMPDDDVEARNVSAMGTKLYQNGLVFHNVFYIHCKFVFKKWSCHHGSVSQGGSL